MRREAVRAAAVCAVLAMGCSLFSPAKYKLYSAQKKEAAGKYEEAVALYEEVATRHRSSDAALTALSRAATLYEEKLNNWQKSAALLQELRALTEGKPEAPQVLLRLARVLEHSGSPYTDALLTYGIICKECAAAPESVASLLSQGRINESLQRWDEAGRIYEEAIAKLGDTPESATVRARLQSVWLLNALSTYFSGQVEEGAALAEKALKRGVTFPEVRHGLEDILRRYQLARSIWKSHPGRLFLQDYTVTGDFDSGQYITKSERGKASAAPAGWELAYNHKKQSFVLTETPPDPPPPVAGKKTKAVKKKKKKPWTFRSPADADVLGVCWSPDARYLGWVDRPGGGSAKEIRVLDLKERRMWQVIRDASGSYVGDSMLFLPRAGKIVFPYGYFLAISDLKGGNRVQLLVRGDKRQGAVFRSRNVEWLAATSDGVSLAAAVKQAPAKKTAKGAVAPPRFMYWKFNLSTNLVLGG